MHDGYVFVDGDNRFKNPTSGYRPHRFVVRHEFWDGVVRHKKDEETHSSSGGPYVCISVYNQLKKQNEALQGAMQHLKTLVYVGGKTDSELEEGLTVDVELQKIRDRLDVLEEVWCVKPVGTHPPENEFPANLEGNYIAMDEDGEWYVYDNRPTVDVQWSTDTWRPSRIGSSKFIPAISYTQYMRTYNRQRWTESLHRIKKAST
jgi:hypothetical protein